MLLVHAHPDDESITTGATMAYYAAAGVEVTLLTCTLGEEGEILVPSLTGLAADEDDQLGGYRISELATAMQALGVRDHRFLGGAGTFRDSGMAGSAASAHPRAFARASDDAAVFGAAVSAAAAVIRETRPQVVITYDPNGDYGHPDHVMAHRVATAALDAAAGAGGAAGGGGAAWQVAKLYWTATATSDLARGFAAARAAGHPRFVTAGLDELGFGVADEMITTTIDASAFVDAKTEALAAHRTQVVVDPPFYAVSNLLARTISGVEHYRLARGELGSDVDALGRERDLFCGVQV